MDTKYYGIFHTPSKSWYRFKDNQLFFTDSQEVAEIQLSILGMNDYWVVKGIVKNLKCCDYESQRIS